MLFVSRAQWESDKGFCRLPPLFTEGCSSLMWIDSLTPLSDHLSSLDKMWTWLSSNKGRWSFRCRTADSGPDELLLLCCETSVYMSELQGPHFSAEGGVEDGGGGWRDEGHISCVSCPQV